MIDDLLVPRTPPAIDKALPRFTSGVARVSGRYQIIGEVACSPPEQCHVALPLRPPMNPPAPSVEHPLFVRVVRKDQLAGDLAKRIRIVGPGIEEVFDVVEEPAPGDATIVSRFIHGASVRALGESLVRRRQRLPWSVALAIYAQARAAIAAFTARTLTHGALTAARIRLDAIRFRTVVCQVMTASAPAPRSDRVELARIVLPLAARGGRELALVNALEADDDLLVLRDHLVEQQQASEELVLAAFDDVGAPPPLVEIAISTLWTWVAGCARVGIT